MKNFLLLVIALMSFPLVKSEGKSLEITRPMTDWTSQLDFDVVTTIPILMNTCTEGSKVPWEDCSFPDFCRPSWYQEGFDSCTNQTLATKMEVTRQVKSKIRINLIEPYFVQRSQKEKVYLVHRDDLLADLQSAGIPLSTFGITENDKTFLVLFSKNLRLRPGSFVTNLKADFKGGDEIKVEAILDKGRAPLQSYSIIGSPISFPRSSLRRHDLSAADLLRQFDKLFRESQRIEDLKKDLDDPTYSNYKKYCHLVHPKGVQKVAVQMRLYPQKGWMTFAMNNTMVMSADEYKPRSQYGAVHADWYLGIPIEGTFQKLSSGVLEVRDGELQSTLNGVSYTARRSPEYGLLIRSDAGDILTCDLLNTVRSFDL
ncbi:MAG: hypothetical protein K2X47_06495 [Bdellovibrionales bacterium]|nr:hypothetical protein [Bdellovibrionales bacterium]